jgi:hypothetical protein
LNAKAWKLVFTLHRFKGLKPGAFQAVGAHAFKLWVPTLSSYGSSGCNVHSPTGVGFGVWGANAFFMPGSRNVSFSVVSTTSA